MIQSQVLNYLIQTGDTTFLTYNNITADFFSDYYNEYNYIKNHLDTYGNIPDEQTMLGRFPDFDIVKVKESPNYLLDALFEDRNTRLLAKVFNNIRDSVNEGNVDKAMEIFTKASDSLASAKHIDCVDITKDISRYDAYVDRCQDYNKYYVTTGFKELDEVIGGWDREEELATIVARPGIGKSWVLLKCAIAALEQGLKVGIYSGEMSERKVGYRFDTLLSHISNYGITKGNSELMNEYKIFIDSLADKYPNGLKILTPKMIDGPAGVGALRAFVEKENLDILCIDQHSLLEDDRHGRTSVEKASNISKDLKNLQVLKRIPIIAVSQQNRSSTEERGQGTEHVAQSDRIAQDSTVILFLEQKDDILTLNLVKCRDASTGKKINYAIDLNKGIFQYIPEETNALDGKGVQELQQEFETEPF